MCYEGLLNCYTKRLQVIQKKVLRMFVDASTTFLRSRNSSKKQQLRHCVYTMSVFFLLLKPTILSSCPLSILGQILQDLQPLALQKSSGIFAASSAGLYGSYYEASDRRATKESAPPDTKYKQAFVLPCLY